MHQRVQATLSSTSHRVHKHAELSSSIRSPADFAAAVGVVPERVAKTLLVRDRGHKVFALITSSSNMRMDMAKISEELGCSRCEVASPEDLAARVGYPRTGVSPLGCPDLPVLMDAGLFAWPTIIVGAGEVGVEVEVDPREIAKLTNARIAAFAVGG